MQKSETLENGRKAFIFNGQKIYEWEQGLDEVNIYIQPPKVVLSKYQDQVRQQLKPGEELPKLEIKIESQHLRIGIKKNPPFIDEDLAHLCDSDDSCWCIDDEELQIVLQKAKKGEVWQSVFKGHQQIDPAEQQELQKKLMLERFQEENPGFDFSQAQFNGMAPDPRTFMGGVKYN